MTKLKLLSAALFVASLAAAPAMARQHHTVRQAPDDTYVSTAAAPDARYAAPASALGCHPAPRVGAFATEPWGNGNVPCEPASSTY